MRELEAILWDYYGQLNEIAAGVKPKPEDVIEKPEALMRYEQVRALNIPYVAGGLEDQPYITLMEDGVVEMFLKAWKGIQKRQEQQWQQVSDHQAEKTLLGP